MTSEVLVTVVGEQFQESDSDPIELVTVGVYEKKGDKHCVSYEEIPDNGDGISQTVLGFNHDKMEMTKKGEVSVNMIFEKGKSNVTYIETVMGSLSIGVTTTKLSVTEQEDEITLNVKYGMDLNYSYVSDCELNILIQAR